MLLFAAIIGVEDISKVDYGVPTTFQPNDVAVFWCCGVTGLEAVKSVSKLPSVVKVDHRMLLTEATLSKNVYSKVQGTNIAHRSGFYHPYSLWPVILITSVGTSSICWCLSSCEYGRNTGSWWAVMNIYDQWWLSSYEYSRHWWLRSF